jgi:transposase InsO family protein
MSREGKISALFTASVRSALAMVSRTSGVPMARFCRSRRPLPGSACLHAREGTYDHRLACLADPSKASVRHQRDAELCPQIQRVWNENYQVYGVRKAWHELKREGFDLARCPVERLMKQIGIRGAVPGKVVETTVPDTSAPRHVSALTRQRRDTSAPCPRDKVNRVFRAPAPNLLWVSDFTYVSTSQGFIDVAPRHGLSDQWRSHGSILDTFADRIVGWRVSRSAKTDFVLDALEQAPHDRRPVQKGGLLHHSDRPSHGLLCKPLPGSGTGNICPFDTQSDCRYTGRLSIHRAIGRSWHRPIGRQRW